MTPQTLSWTTSSTPGSASLLFVLSTETSSFLGVMMMCHLRWAEFFGCGDVGDLDGDVKDEIDMNNILEDEDTLIDEENAG